MSLRVAFRLTVLIGLFPLSALAAASAEAATDTSTPALDAVSRLSAAPVTAGQQVQTSWTAHDDSGIEAIVFTYLDPIGQQRQVRSDNYSGLPGSGTAVATVPGDWPNGIYQLTSASLYDTSS